MAMAPTRLFLDWDRPALPAMADWLVEHRNHDGVVDLAKDLVVLPGGRAGRRLLELLLDRTTADGLRLLPPQTTTIGHLPERLYTPRRPFADDLVQQLAWTEVLKQLDPKALTALLRERPEVDDDVGWMELAGLLMRQHRELAAEGLDFEHVAGSEVLDPLPRERQRWEAMHAIQQAYLETLDRHELWDRQTARLVAIREDECTAPGPILLLGTVDINQAHRQMLQAPRVIDQVTVFVHAPDSYGDRFDELGCLHPSAWQTLPTALPSGKIRIADRPDDQSVSVTSWLSQEADGSCADEITIGVGDESLVPSLRRQLTDSGIETRWIEECTIDATEPWTLLEAIVACLESWEPADDDKNTAGPTLTFAAVASLFRHPGIDDWLARSRGDEDPDSNWIVELDDYQAAHLPIRLGRWQGHPADYPALKSAFDRTVSLLEPLAGQPRGLPEWSGPLLATLATIYDSIEVDRDTREGHVLLMAARHIHTALDGLANVPASLAIDVTAARAIGLALESARRQTIPALSATDAVEMVGWLELALDDAPILAVAGLNEGHVPRSATSDLFLPDSLRQQLGITDNSRRIARDTYALSVVTSGRTRWVLIAGRRTDANEPLLPSRLLLLAPQEDQATRVLELLDTPPRECAARLPSAFAEGPSESGFVVPAPRPPTTPLASTSVTSLRTWLACPYHFYLSYVLKLDSVDDRETELDPLAFGSLVHETLSRFGKDGPTESNDVDEIYEFLNKELWRQTTRIYGERRPASVEIQLRQMSDRLRAFADWQSASVREGWRITHTEESIRAGAFSIDCDAGSLSITGRIDRIDRHLETGSSRVIDYKTSRTPSPPDKLHRKGSGKKKTWIDLQLPLYRRLARTLGVEGEIELGYIVLPRNCTETGFLGAEWTEEELAGADAVTEAAVHGILSGDFFQLNDVPAGRFGELSGLSMICQDDLPHDPRTVHWKPSP